MSAVGSGRDRRRGSNPHRYLRGASVALLFLFACLPEGGPPQIGQTAPGFEAATLGGVSMSLDEFRGEVVLLNLWATWCGPCRFETPFLQSVYEDHSERGLEIVGVSVDDPGFEETIQGFADENGVTYTILHDPAMATMDAYHVIGLPATYLIDREGVIRFIRIGPVSEQDEEFWSALEAALG